MDSIENLNSIFREVISAYPRAEALADGTLIDVSVQAAEAGFKVPVALTATAWEEVVAWSDEDSARQIHQDERGRVYDLLWVAANLARHHKSNNRLSFHHYRIARGGKGVRRSSIALVMCTGPGDDGGPAVTFMLPTDLPGTRLTNDR